MSIAVRDNPNESRYEIHDGEQLVGFSLYRLTGQKIAFTHTEIAPELGGRGLGKRLVAEELEDARRRGLAVLPFCPYVRAFIAGNAAEYVDLVPEEDRGRFGLPSAPAEPGTARGA